jgi:hypothetical protein
MASEMEKARFIHEAQAATLNHLNIATIHAIEELMTQLSVLAF